MNDWYIKTFEHYLMLLAFFSLALSLLYLIMEEIHIISISNILKCITIILASIVATAPVRFSRR
jgi:hypothetical protein